jgi:hypothetical protein
VERSSLASRLLSCCALKRLASRGGRNRSSTRLPVWGVNYKKGACTSPLFHFSACRISRGFESLALACPFAGGFPARPFTYTLLPASFRLKTANRELRTKKMSGRWGERPLGRGMEDSNPKSVGFVRPLGCAREQQNGTGALMLQETQRTSDYLSSLRWPRFCVDSSLGSFSPVPPYFPGRLGHRF